MPNLIILITLDMVKILVILILLGSYINTSSRLDFGAFLNTIRGPTRMTPVPIFFVFRNFNIRCQ